MSCCVWYTLGSLDLTSSHLFSLNLLVNKQVNDKERVAAAMENPDLQHLVDACIAYHPGEL